MQRLKPGVDIVKDILEMAMEAQPQSTFAKSLYIQYQERGGLSKKQLEGLMHKALKIESIPPAKLATLEAIILKKPNRYKSEKPETTAFVTLDETITPMIETVLAKYPDHKRVLFFKNKFNATSPLAPAEKIELERFYKLCKK